MLQPLFDYIAKEWAVLKQAPFTFIGLTVVSVLGGFAVGMLYYSGQLGSAKEQINAKDSQINRYRVALGIEKASKGALVELTNEELRTMALGIATKTHDLCSYLRKESEPLQSDLNSKDARKKTQAFERLRAISSEVAERYNNTLRSDRVLANNELLRRLDKKAAGAVVRVPLFDAETGAQISILSLFGPTGNGVMDSGMMCMAADETEQLAKLLPIKEGSAR